MEWNKERFEQIFDEITEKAENDGEFKKRLLEDTKTVVKEIAGEDVPEGIVIKVREIEGELNIFIYDEEQELTDEDLDNVSGGHRVGGFAPAKGKDSNPVNTDCSFW
jgi:hypothetical protein